MTMLVLGEIPAEALDAAHDLAVELAEFINSKKPISLVASIAIAQLHASSSVTLGYTEDEHLFCSMSTFRQCKATADNELKKEMQ